MFHIRQTLASNLGPWQEILRFFLVFLRPPERCRDGISVGYTTFSTSFTAGLPVSGLSYCSVIKSKINIHNNKLTAAGTGVLLGSVRTDAHSAFCLRHACTPLRTCKRCSHWTDFLKFYWMDFMEICLESRCAVAVGLKYRALYVSTDIRSSVAGDTKPS